MKKLLTLLVSLTITTVIYSQTFVGKVVDSNNKPIPYALLNIAHKNIHTHSSDGGRFMLDALEIGDTIAVTHLAYENAIYIITELSDKVLIKMKETAISIEAITISNEVNTVKLISEVDVKLVPVNSSQDVLRKVPGLLIGQHAGGGKAEQIFLRGFDIDHGTDISITTDGIPVNMVSHAHGQGYADLHFLIPETIDKIDFGVGPYSAQHGNFATAGNINLNTRSSLDYNSVKLEIGQNQTRRLMTMLKIPDNDLNAGYIAAEYLGTNGPFISDQNFSRVNAFGKYTRQIEQGSIDITGSYFTSTWDASGQIPQRAVDSGLITRLGAIDDTEGGTTSRANLALGHQKFLSKSSFIKTKIFFSKYDFELYSNFTFFLDDPINGDQIKQKEDRCLYGLTSEYTKTLDTDNIESTLNVGVSLRSDKSLDNQLAHTLNRTEILENYQLGDVTETNLGIYVNSTFDFGKLLINPSVRVDNFNFGYLDLLASTYSNKSVSKSIVSPKINFAYNFSPALQLYTKLGKGFHSNDSRVVVTDEELNTIPAAYGYDVGTLWKPTPNIIVNAAYWYLFLEQEFVYVGDAGIVEPSGRTKRQGVDLSIKYQPKDWLYLTTDINFTKPRSLDEADGQDYIPLAPTSTITGGITYSHHSGLTTNLNLRHLADRAANEDYSIVAEGYSVFDLNVNYSLSNVNFGFQIQNLLNTEWNETQFATESRLFDEPESVTEIHFTPGTPFFIKGIVEYKF